MLFGWEINLCILTGLFGPLMEWCWKIRNLSLCSKIFEHCHLVQNFPRFQRRYWKFSPTLFHWATVFFIWSLKCAIWVWSTKRSNEGRCIKIFEHCHLVQNFPRDPEMFSKIQSDLFHWATVFFSSRVLENGQFEFM